MSDERMSDEEYARKRELIHGLRMEYAPGNTAEDIADECDRARASEAALRERAETYRAEREAERDRAEALSTKWAAEQEACAALREENERLRGVAVILLRFLEDEQRSSWPRTWDHACGECIPGGDLVIAGFRCAVHQARTIRDERAALSKEPTP